MPARQGYRSYDAIPEPTDDLIGAVQGLKGAFELLIGATGLRDDQALTFRDLPMVPGNTPSTQPDVGHIMRYVGGTWTNSVSGDLVAQNVAANGALTIDRAKGEYVNLLLNGNVSSFAVLNWSLVPCGCKVVLVINNTGAFNINAWPTGTVWPGGVAPTVTSGANKKDVIMLLSYDAGTTIFGVVVGQDYL